MFHHSRLRLEKIGRGAILVREGSRGVVEITNTVFHFYFFFFHYTSVLIFWVVKKFLWYHLILYLCFWVLVLCYVFFRNRYVSLYFSPSIWSCKNSSKFPPKSPRNEIERICKEASKLFESLTKHKIHKSGAEKKLQNL